jgi:DNA-binding beta-propeller fold protein YncE
LDLKTEKIVATWSNSPADKPHGMAMVPGTDQVLVVGETGKLGTISVVVLDHNGLAALPPLTSSPGAHSIAVDPQTHTVWIAFAKNDKPYVQAFAAK